MLTTDFSSVRNNDTRAMLRDLAAFYAAEGKPVRMFCLDPRHATVCAHIVGDDCVACNDECDTHHWFNADGSSWGDTQLLINSERAQ